MRKLISRGGSMYARLVLGINVRDLTGGYKCIRRQVLEDPDRRRALFDRFVFSQKFAQVDPWAERASGKDRHEFRPMAAVGFAQAAE